MPTRLHELEELERLIDKHPGLIRARELATVTTPRGQRLPVLGLVIGARDLTAPTLGLFGGVHGLERIGTHTAFSYLKSLVELARWDRHTQQRLERTRLVAIPLLNPAGMALSWRSNPHGVDLMRNAPIDSAEKVPWPLGGHRLGPWLPWYRGPKGAPMEIEAQALVDFVRAEMFSASAAISLDLHSGFGLQDRLWYPYASATHAFPDRDRARRLGELLDATYPYHIYRFEPQSDSYTTHGDLWDYIYDLHRARTLRGVYLPLTLEMGSWLWVRKNPRQLLARTGPFNPVLPHRRARVLRRHLLLVDFLTRAVDNHTTWSGSQDPPPEER